jgi:arylsulfatase A-like enzyme
MMGYRTPNIDRIAKEGALFTDWYGQQSCTAGRAAFITGQSPIRTGLTKVGMPGATSGLSAKDPTIAELLKAAGLRHRPVRQEPPGRPQRTPADRARLRRVLRQPLPPQRRGGAGEPRLSQGPEVHEKFGPRGVLHCKASDQDDKTVDPAFGRVGKQVIENTGALTKKRMETVDEEFLDAAKDFIQTARPRRAPGSATSTRPACTSSPT